MQAIVRNEGRDQQGIIYGQPSAVGTVVGSSHALTVFGMEEMRTAIAAAHDPVVGYYRIREGNSLELTTDEINLAVTLFARPGSVILLVERRAGCPEANFFFMEHGAFLNLPLLAFPLDAATLIERESQRVRRTDEEAVVPAAPGLRPPSSGPTSPPTDANGKPGSRRRPATRLWTSAIVISVAVASFSAALFIYRPHDRISNAGATRSTLLDARTSLQAVRQGDDLKIMWDLNSPAVAGATSGVLDINDGGATRQIPMTADQVRFGSLLYSPVSEQVSVRLTTLKDDQSTEQESVLVLLRKPPQPQSSNGHQIPRVPFEVKTERMPSTRALVPPTGNREIMPSVKLEDPPAIQASPQRVELPAPLPLGSVSPPPAIAVPQGEPAKPTIQASPERVELPAPLPLAPVSPPPAIAVPQGEPAKPPEEAYVAAVLIAREGVPTPRELLSILTQPVAVRVRVDVNAAGRVTRAEAIAEKGIHALLLRAATDAAWRCRFQPARRGQSPVSSTVTIVFHIGPEKE